MPGRPRNDAAVAPTGVHWRSETPEAPFISDAMADRLSRHAVCPSCGTRRMPGVRFCPTCGIDLETDRAAPGVRSWVIRRAAVGRDPSAQAVAGLLVEETKSRARITVAAGLLCLNGRH